MGLQTAAVSVCASSVPALVNLLSSKGSAASRKMNILRKYLGPKLSEWVVAKCRFGVNACVTVNE